MDYIHAGLSQISWQDPEYPAEDPRSTSESAYVASSCFLRAMENAARLVTTATRDAVPKSIQNAPTTMPACVEGVKAPNPTVLRVMSDM
mmetsp:Transcript_79032/g.213970  ORF Transcript_79032/g.213970 Transcript_79032/m.213970 type:complete len:89 (+) Transcript_79032:310-576(+)